MVTAFKRVPIVRKCMGAASLSDLAVTSPIERDALAGSTGAVDAFNWLYRYMTRVVRETDPSVYTTHDGTEVPNLVGIVRGLSRFFEIGFFPVFVFDGSPVPLKQSVLSARRERQRRASQKAKSAQKRGDADSAAKHRARAVRLTSPIRRSTEELFEFLDLPVVHAPSEAEAQAAHMTRIGSVDYTVTDDYDALLYGSPHTVREFTSDKTPECMDFERTLERHDISWSHLVDVAILCGTDYNEGVPGFGPERALAEIRRWGTLERVLARRDATVENADRIRDLFVHPQVTDAAFERTCRPDLAAARTYLVDEWEVPDAAVESAFDRLAATRSVWS